MNGLELDIAVERGGLVVRMALAVAPGTVAAIIGPNGAGKSTIVDAIAGLTGVDEGHIRLGSELLADSHQGLHVPARARRIGVVFQDRVLFPHLTALENVSFGLTARGMPREAARSRAATLLAEWGLDHVAGRPADELSGGEAQRVAVIRALAIEPRALLLDEPFAAVDAAARVDLRRTIADQVGRFAGPVVLVTHDPTEAYMLADEVCVLEAGRVTQQGTPDDIRLRPASPYAADFAGVNLVSGICRDGVVEVGAHRLRVADTTIRGAVVAAIQPSAIAVYRQEPGGSPRNSWSTKIDAVESLGDRVRLHVGAPLPLTVEVTPGAVEALSLAPGIEVWLSVKATEIGVQPG